MANYRFAEAQRLMDELLALYPENQAVRQLARELDAQRRWLFEAEAKPSNSDGGGANAAGQALILQAQAHHAADRRQLAAVRDRRLCQRPSARGLHRADARRRRRGMAHPESHSHDLADAILGHRRPAGRRCHGRLACHRPGAARLFRRALLPGIRRCAPFCSASRPTNTPPRRPIAGMNRAASRRASPTCRSRTATSDSPAA